MKRWGVFAAVSVFLLALTGAPAAAQPADCPPVQGITCDGWVTDAAGVIEDDAGLESLVSGVVQNFGRQIAVVIVDSTGSTSASSFAQDIGNTWGVGLAGEDDGVVVATALRARNRERQKTLDLLREEHQRKVDRASTSIPTPSPHWGTLRSPPAISTVASPPSWVA